MASSGKKGKKSKGKTLPLTDFLQETPGPTSLKKYSWSDEVEHALEGYESRPKTSVLLPTAPRAARGPDISDDRIPSQPPYIAYISNLPYDVDEEEIADFFRDLNIANMRLPRDDRGGDSGKLKGFGYVEFEDRNSLIDAISLVDTNLKGRRIKIDVATSSDGDRRRGRMDLGRDRGDRPEVTMGDWRAGPRMDPVSDNRGSGYGRERERDRDRDRDRDRERDREVDNRPGGWRDGDRPAFQDRGYSGGGDADRNRGGYGGRFSDRDRERGRDRERDGDRGFGARRYGGDNYERDGEFRRGPREEPPLEREQPRSRPKLLLTPRTKPLEDAAASGPGTETNIQKEPVPVAAAGSAGGGGGGGVGASIFGAAKPVDTSARERQIEERLAREREARLAAPTASSPAQSRDRDSSRDNNRSRGDDEDERSASKPREAWGRRRNDERSDETTRRDTSEGRRPTSRGPPTQKKTDDRKPQAVKERVPVKKDDRPAARTERPPRDNHEREMPKAKEPEPPNFAASNIFASLETEGDQSD